MSNYTPAADRTIYSGTCSDTDCMTSMAIWPNWESTTDLPHQDEWENGGIFLDCPVCGETMDLDFTDPMTTHIRTGYATSQFQEEA